MNPGGRDRPTLPPNRVLGEWERICPACGRGERDHRGWQWSGHYVQHPFPFTWLQKTVARLTLLVWPTKRALYITGKIDRP